MAGPSQTCWDEVATWRADDFWQYAMYAAAAYIRAPPAGQASQSARHARTWTSAPAAKRHSADYSLPIDDALAAVNGRRTIHKGCHSGADIRINRVSGPCGYRCRTGSVPAAVTPALSGEGTMAHIEVPEGCRRILSGPPPDPGPAGLTVRARVRGGHRTPPPCRI